MTDNSHATEVYGLVVKIRTGHCLFYASASFDGNHDAVIERARGNDKAEIFLCLPDDKKGFRLEPVEGDWKKLITNDTSVKINRENLLWRQKGGKGFSFTHREFDCRPKDGETFAHFIAETALFVCEEEREKIPFHLFSPEILALKGSAGCSVAVVMAANKTFPPEMLNDENIDTDPMVPYYLLFYNRITDDCDDESYYRDYSDLEDRILTKERLINCNADDVLQGANLAVIAALNKRLPERFRYDPDILMVTKGLSILGILMSDIPDYAKRFPACSMIPKLLETEINMYIKSRREYGTISLRDALVDAGRFPENEPEAILWLTFVSEDDEKVRAAELFYQLEYPDQYEGIIQSIRDAYREKCSGQAGFTGPSIF